MKSRGRLALAVLVSILLHGAMLMQRGFLPREAERPRRLSVTLNQTPQVPATLPSVPQTHIDLPEPTARPKVLTRPSAPKATPPLRRPPAIAERPESAPESVETPQPARPSGRELASDALASVQDISREMGKQERRLDPARGHMTERAGSVPRNPVAIALEKQFGRPVPFYEESIEQQTDGSTLYRVSTELGSVCMKSVPPNVAMAAPGQGILGRTLMVPMTCPGSGKK